MTLRRITGRTRAKFDGPTTSAVAGWSAAGSEVGADVERMSCDMDRWSLGPSGVLHFAVVVDQRILDIAAGQTALCLHPHRQKALFHSFIIAFKGLIKY